MAVLPLAVAAGPSALPTALDAPTAPVARLSDTLTAADTVPISEWTVPWERTRPRDPFVDPKTGDVWFVGQQGNYVGRLNPQSGEFRRYELDQGDYPHNVIVDADGTVWYTGNRNRNVSKLDPATGKVTRYAMPDTTVRDPHTAIFGRNGTVLFTAQGGNAVGRLDKSTGEVRLVKMSAPNARPYGIELDSKGNAWFNQFNTNKIGKLDPTTMTVTDYALPHADARGRRIAVTADDMVWYVDYRRGFLGRLNPETRKVDEWPMPSGADARPYAMTKDDQGRLWFVETGVQPNRLVGFDPKTSQFFSNTPIRSSGAERNTVRHMVFDPKTGMIWFGTDAGTIGRATVSRPNVM
jgi:virginiamycin B lyase